MRVLFVSSEVAPFSKTGGLGDVSGALPQALAARGHEVLVVTPLYGRIDLKRFPMHPVRALQGLSVQMGSRRVELSGSVAQVPGNPPVYFVNSPHSFRRHTIYTNDADEHRRFLTLVHGALLFAQRLRFAPDIIHVHDWQTAMLPLILRVNYSWDQQIFGRSRTVLTIHNLSYQGKFPASIAPELGLRGQEYLLHQDQLRDGVINFLLHGILYANAITTVSPTYAQEIRTPEHGEGLDWALRSRSDVLFGILNGVDADAWNPARDKLIPYRYDALDLTGKERNKNALLARFRLPSMPGAPLVGIVSRLASQKGLDLVPEGLLPMLRAGSVQVAVLGQGERRLEGVFQDLRNWFPRQVAFQRQFDESLAHQIQAGSDFILVPSRFEPCGLTQMYGLRYGTVPIVRKTGGLADTVEPWSPSRRTGTGVVFNDFNSEAVHWAAGAARELYQDRSTYRLLQRNGMGRNFSWDVQVQEYERLYAMLNQ